MHRYRCDVPHPLDHAELRTRVNRALADFLAGQARTLELVGDELTPVVNTASSFLLEGGKRLRPAFAYWGYRGAGGRDSEEVLQAVASLELLHACALIHDDLMDGSDTRRGLPAVHRLFAGMHREEEWVGDPEAFGLSAAILLGDLCLVWADQMFHRSGLESQVMLTAQTLHDEMRVELMAGQYLDVLEQSLATQSIDRSMRVARYKSGKYTVERPLHFGGALASATAEVIAAYSDYGLPLGEAFQLRDDILGVFGDPSETGKPAGDDLREGKRTVLIAATLDRADTVQTHQMRRLLGDPGLDVHGVESLREIILQTGALAYVESLIDSLMARSLDALRSAPIDDEARHVLHDLAVAATKRSV
jgi:geranylgeranyl diphosphate synthase, type I